MHRNNERNARARDDEQMNFIRIQSLATHMMRLIHRNQTHNFLFEMFHRIIATYQLNVAIWRPGKRKQWDENQKRQSHMRRSIALLRKHSTGQRENENIQRTMRK